MLKAISDDAVLLDDARMAPLRRFVEWECRLLDDQRFEKWLELYAPTATYWAPAKRGQASPYDHVSLFWDDKETMQIRVERLLHPEIHSQIPASATMRMVNNFRAVAAGEDFQVECRFLMVEDRLGSARLAFAGTLHYLLAAQGKNLQILHKRVDLTNCDHAFNALTQPF